MPCRLTERAEEEEEEEEAEEEEPRYRKCDGHIFYTDHAAPGPQKAGLSTCASRHFGACPPRVAKQEADFMRVVVPPQSVGRDDDNWLYHRTATTCNRHAASAYGANLELTLLCF